MAGTKATSDVTDFRFIDDSFGRPHQVRTTPKNEPSGFDGLRRTGFARMVVTKGLRLVSLRGIRLVRGQSKRDGKVIVTDRHFGGVTERHQASADDLGRRVTIGGPHHLRRIRGVRP